MGRRKKQIVLENVEITGLGAKGRGIGKAPDGRVVFVPYTAPGDVADVQTKKKRKTYYEGKALNFKKLSDLRTDPDCPYFGTCGGCQLQHISYESQVDYKAKSVVENIKRIGGFTDFEIKTPLASPVIFGYRNKMEYAFTASKWLTDDEIRSDKAFDRRGLGFHVPGHWDKILDIDRCSLQPEPGNTIRNALRDFAKKEDISFYHPRERSGHLRQLTVRITKKGDIMVLVHFAGAPQDVIEKTMLFLQNTFPGITSLLYLVNTKANDSIYDLDIKLWSGKPYIEEQIGELTFRIKPKSFFQTNSFQTEQLYDRIKTYARIEKHHTVYDLYSGTGSIGLFVAGDAGKVIGLESVEQAVDDARENARLNGIANAEFFAGDMKDIFNADFLLRHGKPDIIITDPPREGMHPHVVETILKFPPERIVYVSCNSATQARDLSLLKKRYELRFIQPVDMFPQTYHMENIAVLERKNPL